MCLLWIVPVVVVVVVVVVLSFDLISLVGNNLGFPGLWLSRLDLVVRQLSSGIGSGSCRPVNFPEPP